MGIGLDGYTMAGVLHAAFDAPGRLVDALEGDEPLQLTDGRLVRLDSGAVQDVRGVRLMLDDLCLAAAAADTVIPGHLQWHELRLIAGPWRVTGAMPTMFGFDPGRALARPQGAFVLLRDVSVGLAANPDAEDALPYAWVNRYVVDRVEADIDLGFFFPGAEGASRAIASS
ncbi:MAG: hypothetical protein ACHQZR_09655 [Candidatus Limnocylindrales bacterium]